MGAERGEAACVHARARVCMYVCVWCACVCACVSARRQACVLFTVYSALLFTMLLLFCGGM